jgi:hypothetical protein
MFSRCYGTGTTVEGQSENGNLPHHVHLGSDQPPRPFAIGMVESTGYEERLVVLRSTEMSTQGS